LFVLLLELLLPREEWQVVAEYALTREPRRIDAVIVRRVEASSWHPEYLCSVLDDLHAHNIIHFKGATDELERADALQLLSYAYQYMALKGLQAPAEVSLRVVAPTLTPRFRAQLEALDGVLSETPERGVYRGRVQGFALRVAETSVAWPNPGEHLLYAVSPACLQRPALLGALDDGKRDLYYRLLQGITQLAHDPRWKAIMKDASLVKEAAGQALRDLLASLPPEVRLAGLDPEVRLAGHDPQEVLGHYKPEERLAGLQRALRPPQRPRTARSGREVSSYNRESVNPKEGLELQADRCSTRRTRWRSDTLHPADRVAIKVNGLGLRNMASNKETMLASTDPVALDRDRTQIRAIDLA